MPARSLNFIQRRRRHRLATVAFKEPKMHKDCIVNIFIRLPAFSQSRQILVIIFTSINILWTHNRITHKSFCVCLFQWQKRSTIFDCFPSHRAGMDRRPPPPPPPNVATKVRNQEVISFTQQMHLTYVVWNDNPKHKDCEVFHPTQDKTYIADQP